MKTKSKSHTLVKRKRVPLIEFKPGMPLELCMRILRQNSGNLGINLNTGD